MPYLRVFKEVMSVGVHDRGHVDRGLAKVRGACEREVCSRHCLDEGLLEETHTVEHKDDQRVHEKGKRRQSSL